MRLQIVLDENEERVLNWLEETIGARTHKDLFDNAMTLLQWAVEQRLNLRMVASFNLEDKSYRELQMPALERAAQIGRDRQQSQAASEAPVSAVKRRAY